MRDSRATIIQAAVTETTDQSGIQSKIWMDTGNQQADIVNARCLFISKLPSLHINEIAAYTGWSIITVRVLKGRGPASNAEARELTEAETSGVAWLVSTVAGKHGLAVDRLRGKSAAEKTARWEIVGRLMHQGKLNQATIKVALAPHGIKPIIDDFIQGFALCMPVEGVEMQQTREVANRGDRGLIKLLGSEPVSCGSSMALVVECVA